MWVESRKKSIVFLLLLFVCALNYIRESIVILDLSVHWGKFLSGFLNSASHSKKVSMILINNIFNVFEVIKMFWKYLVKETDNEILKTMVVFD